MQIRVLIQARMSSTRLPAKALLPIASMPSAVLCARRAANSGMDVRVATSDDPADDCLAETLKRHDVRVVRGPLDDVLGRYAQSVADLAADDIVVRLTADNVFPDGQFVEGLVNAMMKLGAYYSGTNSPPDGLPYGLSAEAFKVAALREAHDQATLSFDREHVTPWIIRRYGSAALYNRRRLNVEDFSRLRCTLDTLEDYLRLQRVFRDVPDPVRIPWRRLVDVLSELPDAPRNRIPYRMVGGDAQGQMALGTVQLGMPYGAANTTGQPGKDESSNIVREAVKHGVTYIDTARAYGDAESRVGNALVSGLRERVTLVTKLDPLESIEEGTPAHLVRKAVDGSVFRSCRELRTQKLDVLMLHRWEHRHLWDGAAWKRLHELQNEGVVGKLGVSVYHPEEAVEALRESAITFIQVPFNLLDWRWRDPHFTKTLRGRPDVIIHARSVLLQGILAAPASRWPKIPGQDAEAWVRSLEALAAKLGRKGRADLCIAYVRAQPWITSIVIGVETLTQLRDNIALFQNPELSPGECRLVEQSLARAPEELLNPGRWNAAC